MGYRHYFYKVSRADVEEIQNLTYKQLVKYCQQNGRGYYREDYGDGDGDIDESFDIHKIIPQTEFFGFGKYYENALEVQKKGQPLFLKKRTAKYFEDYEPYVCGVEALECAINWQVDIIKKNYDELLWTDEELEKQREDENGDFCDERTQLERLQWHIRRKKNEWDANRLLPFSLDRDRDFIQSWMYEYTIFALVKLHREMDWEKDCLLFYGW